MTTQSLGFDVTADTSGLMAQLMAAGNMTEKQAGRMIKSIQTLDAQVKAWTKSQQAANNEVARVAQAANDAEALASANDHAGKASAGMTRELIVLGHELSQGNFKRFGGSLLVLAEYSKTATAALGYLIGPLGAVAAAGALAGVAFVEGYMQSSAFVKSLVLTGNAAGVTADEMDRLVSSTAKAAGATVGATRDVLQGLVTGGQFGPDTLGKAAEAVLKLQKVSGASSEEVVKDFEKMNEGVAKWALEHNRQMNFMSVSYYEQIKKTEELGNQEGAMSLVLDRLNERLNSSRSFWDKLKIAASGAWAEFVGNGRDETVGERLANINAQLSAMDRVAAARLRLPAFSSAPSEQYPGQQSDLEQQRRVVLMDQLRQAENAAAAAESARVQKAGVAARVLVDQVLAETKGRDLLNQELEKYNRLFKESADAGKPYSDAQQKTVLDEVRKRYTAKDNPGDTFIKQLQRQVEEQGKGKYEMLELEAAQKKVSAAAGPYIVRLQKMELRAARIARIVADTAEEEKQAAKVTDFRSGNDATIKGYIDQAEEIGKTADEMARLNLQRTIENNLRKSLIGADSGTAQALYAAAEKAQADALSQLNVLLDAKRAFNADATNGIKPALVGYFDEATNRAKKMSDGITGALKSGEDAFVSFAQTGKLSVGSLFSYIEEQLLRASYQSYVAQAITAGGGASNFSFNTLLSKVFASFGTGGAIAGSYAGIGNTGGIADLVTAPNGIGTYANGLSYVPYDGFPAILHEGERVQTALQARNSDNSNSGASVTYSPVFNVSGPQSQETLALIRAEVNRSQTQFARQLRLSGALS